MREHDRINSNRYNHRIRLETITLLGSKCIWCGETDLRCLQVDHINGGGNKDRQNHKGKLYPIFILNQIKSGSKDYQLLCANCNWRKRYDNREGYNQVKYV